MGRLKLQQYKLMELVFGGKDLLLVRSPASPMCLQPIPLWLMCTFLPETNIRYGFLTDSWRFL